MKILKLLRPAALLLIAALNVPAPAIAQGTAITYQGRLSDNAGAVNGSYDFSFQLFDAASGGASQGSLLSKVGLTVSDGLFTVTLDFGASPFSAGDPRWLEISVRTNGGGAFGLISPRQALTATPYAVTAGKIIGPVDSAGLSGNYFNAVNFGNTGNTFSGAFAGNGGGLSNVNAASLGGVSASNVWQTGGNYGANNSWYLGTADYQALELRVNKIRGFRLLPTLSNWPNAILGASNNVIFSDVTAASIGGGVNNSIADTCGSTVIGGGRNNLIQLDSAGSFIGGGQWNVIREAAVRSVISGGYSNQIRGFTSTNAHSIARDITDGTSNTLLLGETPPGNATIGGGYLNTIGQDCTGAVIAGGEQISLGDGSVRSVVAGGNLNQIGVAVHNGFIGGGASNSIGNNSSYSALAGGSGNFIGNNCVGGVISGGLQNTIPSNANYATIPGGSLNLAAGDYSFAAGRRAQANQPGTFVWADSQNADFASAGSNQFLIRAVGGVGIGTTSPTLQLTVGGAGNYVSKAAAAIMLDNTTTANGRRWEWHALDDGRMQFVDFNASASRLMIDTNGNIGMGTGNPASALDVESPVGVNVALRLVSGGSWPLIINQAPDSLFTVTNGGQARLAITSGGFVGIGTQVPAEKLHVVGNILASGTVTASGFVGSGSGLSDLNAASLDGLTSAGFWKANGNAGVNPTNGAFFGTTDNLPLEIKVNGQRALRIEPNATSPNIVGGYFGNVVSNGFYGATIVGGGWFQAENRVGNDLATVLGGVGNRAIGRASTAMGVGSIAEGNGAIAIGGSTKAIGDGSVAIGGGTVTTGFSSTAMGVFTTANGDYSTAMGFYTTADGESSTVMGDHTIANDFASTAMGSYAFATGRVSTAMGYSTIASGEFSTAMGYQTWAGGDYSTAMGFFAHATNQGTFVWADSISSAPFTSTGNNQFLIRASGGVGIGTTAPEAPFHVAEGSAGAVSASANAIAVFERGGAGYVSVLTPAANESGILFGNPTNAADGGVLFNANTPRGLEFRAGGNSMKMVIAAGGNVGIGVTVPTNRLHVAGGVSATVFVTTSDRNAKENFAAVSPAEVLAKVTSLPITKWNFKEMKDGAHLGPMAQDFYAAFGLGGGDTTITTVDADGVALAAIQGLNQKVEEKDSRIRELEKRLENLEHLLNIKSKEGHE